MEGESAVIAKLRSMDYGQAISFLRELGKFGTNLGLGRTLALLRATGDPHEEIKAIHIAGTNGKGSVAAMVASVLQASGFRVGLYTSPHLSSYTERIRVNGKDIPRSRVGEIMGRLRPLFEEIARDPTLGPPTEFEMGTVMAFLYFAEERVDFAVVEVGLGGRFDATNVLEPLVSVITHVDIDHIDKLGDTVEKIAFEKAGIIKPRVPVVVGRQDGGALAVIKRVAAERSSPIMTLGEEIACERTDLASDGQTLRVSVCGEVFDGLKIPLLGRHQVDNAATAVGAACVLRGIGVDVSRESVARGLERVRWPGRLEVLQTRPLVVVDCAHNLDGIESLAASVGEVTGGRQACVVVGLSRDKPAEAIMRKIAGFAPRIIATCASSSRLGGLDPATLAALAGREGCETAVDPSPRRAVDKGLELAREDGALVVCGSLYLVGEVRNHLLSVAGRLPATRRIVVFSGGYGSGKTEVSLNYAVLQREHGKKRVIVVDLDIMNPYFRSREAAEALARKGVQVVSSARGLEAADLPALAPEILQAFQDESATVVFDAGGDPAGARALARYCREFAQHGYDMYFVLNANRPFTRDVAGAMDMLESIEGASRLSFSGIVSNTHMGDDTTPDDVRLGARVATLLAREENLPVVFASGTREVLSRVGDSLGTRLVPLCLYMRPPWQLGLNPARKESSGLTK